MHVYIHTHIYRSLWKIVFEGHADQQAIHSSMAVKEPKATPSEANQTESYINHHSVYCSVCTAFMAMSLRLLLYASEIGNIMEGRTIDIFHFCINAPGCTLCPRLLFFFEIIAV